MSAPLSPIPQNNAVVDNSGTVTQPWFLWLYELWARVRTLTQVTATKALSNQNASIVAGQAYGVAQTGIYRVAYCLRVTTLPTTSYSLTVTLGWRTGGVTRSQAFTALTGAPGTLALGFQTGELPLVRCDSGTGITYDVAYVSVGATPMVYWLDVAVELVN